MVAILENIHIYDMLEINFWSWFWLFVICWNKNGAVIFCQNMEHVFVGEETMNSHMWIVKVMYWKLKNK